MATIAERDPESWQVGHGHGKEVVRAASTFPLSVLNYITIIIKIPSTSIVRKRNHGLLLRDLREGQKRVSSGTHPKIPCVTCSD